MDRSWVDRNAWLDDLSSPLVASSVSGTQTCDWLVVGAGYTGLAAARRLAQARAGDRVLLVDAGTIGDSASSRSSGFVVPQGHFGRHASENRNLFRLGSAGVDQLRQMVEQHGIECQWSEQGRIIATRGLPGQHSLKHICRAMDQVQAPWDPCTSTEIKTWTAMEGYLGGIVQRGAVMVNPARLQRGLLNSLPSNVEFFQRSRLKKLVRGQHLRAELDDGEIIASRVLLTNNASAMSLGWARNRLFPMRTFVSAYRVDDNYGPIGEVPDWGLTSVERVGSSLRRIGNRIQVRNTAFFGESSGVSSAQEIDAVAKLHRDALTRRFPGIQAVHEATWGGTICVSANGAQVFGQVADGCYLSAGYNGHGIAQGTISGQLLADLALHRESKLLTTMQALPVPRWIPKSKVLPVCVNAYLRFLLWRYRSEI